MTTIVLEVLGHLRVTQEHDTTLQKYWLLAFSTHAEYSIVYNSIGEFLTFKGQLYVPKVWYQLYFLNTMMLEDILDSSRPSR